MESAIISYEASGQIAHELAARFCSDRILANGANFLLGSPTNVSAIQAAMAFDEALTQLSAQYESLEGKTIGTAGNEFFSLAITPGASSAITAIAGAVNDIKTQTTQTAATFTPVDQALFSDLEREMDGVHGASCRLVTTAYPKVIAAARKKLNVRINALLNEQGATQAKRAKDGIKYSDDKLLQGIDSQLSTLEQTLGNATATMAGSTILLGEALLETLGEKYHVITVANVAAGGGTRANVYFLVNILFPAPRPSYNGGSAVAYTLRTGDGVYESADLVYFMFGYTKWDQPKFPSLKNTKGFSSFQWTPPDGLENK